MTRPDHEPLTQEERELAQRLARLGAHAEPSAALDAGILAAARAATGAAIARPVATTTTRRAHPRFFRAAGLGIAASLVLAVGIAWQLRPLPDADVLYSEAPSAAAPEPARTSADAGIRAPEAFPAPPSPQPLPEEVAARRPVAQSIESPREQKQSAPVRSKSEGANTAADEASVVFDDPSPIDTPAPQPAPPPPAPPAPPSSPAPQPDLSALPPAGTIAPRVLRDASGESESESESRTRAREAMPEADAQRRAESLDRVEITGTRIHQDEDDFFQDQPYDDEPPASADSPEVRKAWLARIRELVDEGRIDAARASLAEFRRRYPAAALPDDLRPLLE